MKKIEFKNLPAGSIVLAKKYNLWDRFKAWITRKPLKYNDAWIDPFGCSGFLFQDTFWTKHNVFTFIPRKKYSHKEMLKMFEKHYLLYQFYYAKYIFLAKIIFMTCKHNKNIVYCYN